jgi:hypothetical protein
VCIPGNLKYCRNILSLLSRDNRLTDVSAPNVAIDLIEHFLPVLYGIDQSVLKFIFNLKYRALVTF